jgi:hypothetical protein
VTAHGVADHYYVLPGESVHNGEEVAGEVLGGVGARLGPVAQAVPALVEGEDVKPIHEGSRYFVEPVGMGSTAVQEAKRRAPRHTPLEEMHGEALGADSSTPRPSTGESMSGHAAIVRGRRNFFAPRPASE